MHDASNEMRAYYAARAPYYDAVYDKPERRADIAFLRQHLPERFVGRTVLEVACGTGYWTQHIAPAASRMWACDLTAEPLAFARVRPNTQNVTFAQADAYALPDSFGLFDGAFAGLWLSHVPVGEREQFFASLHARLTLGARVVFLENNEAQLRDFPIAETDSQGNTYQHRALRDGSMHRVLKNFPTETELRSLFAAFSRNFTYRNLENFWMVEYELLK